MAQGGHLLSGLKRFCPGMRFKLPTTTQFYKNWQRIHHPERAVPISWELLLAMAGVCLTQGFPGISLMLLVGFMCFLRSSEMLSLQALHLMPHRDGQRITVIIPFAKTSNGNPQVITYSDPRVWSLAVSVKQASSPTRPLWAATPGAFRASGKISWRSLTSMVPTMPPTAFGEEVPLGISSKRPLWTPPCSVTDGAVAAQLNNTLIRGPWQWPDFYGPAHNVAVSSSGPSREPNISGVFDREKALGLWEVGSLYRSNFSNF